MDKYNKQVRKKYKSSQTVGSSGCKHHEQTGSNTAFHGGKKSQKKRLDVAPLDKLAQVGTECGNHATDSLQFELDKTTKASDTKVLAKRARSKYFSDSIKSKLCSIEKTPLLKSYKGSCSCSDTIAVEDGAARSSYCKQRWCLTCCRIKMGAMINKYLPILKAKMTDPYFVTLTIPSITKGKLKEAMQGMFKTLSSIKDMIRKQHQRGQIECTFTAVVKMECTYNAEKDTYHPHLHCVVDTKSIAETLHNEWLDRYPEAKVVGQDVRKADDKSMKELLKYSVKMMSEIIDNEGNTKQAIYIHALNQMFISMKGLRIFRSFGELYNVKLDAELSDDEMSQLEKESEEQLAIEFPKVEPSNGCYTWVGYDWYNTETGESLCNYKPTDKERDFESKLILHRDKSAHTDLMAANTSDSKFIHSDEDLLYRWQFLKNANIEPISTKIKRLDRIFGDEDI